MKKSLISTIFLLVLNWSSSLAQTNVYIMADDPDIEKYNYKKLAEEAYLDQKRVKLNEFLIFNNTTSESFPVNWSGKKNKLVSYLPKKISCNYSPCELLQSIVSEKRTEKTKLFFGQKQPICETSSLNIETSLLNTNSMEVIKAKIEEELIINKSLKKELTLIFYLPSKNNLSQPKVSFVQDTIEGKYNEPVNLEALLDGVTKNIEWTNSTFLSCNDCANPTASVKETTTFKVSGENDLGCSSNDAKITVFIKEKCKDFNKASILYYLEGAETFYRAMSDRVRWKIAAIQPGSPEYYLVCQPNCGETFKVEISDNNAVIWKDTFRRSDIESGQSPHYDFPDKFIFKINIDNIYNFDKSKFYKFRITTNDDKGNRYGVYDSPPTKFVDCGFL